MPSPNFRNQIRGYRKNFETGPRLSNSLPQREGARLPPGARRASRLLFPGFHPVPGAHWGAGSSAPRLRAERPDSSLAGSAGQLHVARRGRIRWVMWRRCRTCPCADSGNSSRASEHCPHPLPLPNAAETPRRRLLGVGNHMCWRGWRGCSRFRLCAVVGRQGLGAVRSQPYARVLEKDGPLPAGLQERRFGGRGGSSATPPALRRPSLASSSHIGQQQDSQ